MSQLYRGKVQYRPTFSALVSSFLTGKDVPPLLSINTELCNFSTLKFQTPSIMSRIPAAAKRRPGAISLPAAPVKEAAAADVAILELAWLLVAGVMTVVLVEIDPTTINADEVRTLAEDAAVALIVVVVAVAAIVEDAPATTPPAAAVAVLVLVLVVAGLPVVLLATAAAAGPSVMITGR